MPAAAMQLTLLVFAVALCPGAGQTTTVMSTNHASSSSGTSIQTPAQTQKNTAAVAPDSVSITPTTPPTRPTQTDNRTEATSPSPAAPNTTATFTPKQTVSPGPSVQATTNVTRMATVKATSAGLSHGLGSGDLAENPGLVAVICIFCIIFVLVLVVALFKCTKSPRSRFERLDDVPMGQVSESSPFAQKLK